MDEFCGSRFWDTNVTWNTESPNFTECFQKTVLIWAPCLTLWILTPFEVYYAISSKLRFIPWSLYNITKMTATSLLMTLSFIDIIYALYIKDGETYSVEIFTPLFKLLTFVLASCLTVMNRLQGVRSSGIFFIFWFLLFICGIPQYLNEVYHNMPMEENYTYPYISYMIYYPLVVMMLVLNCFVDAMPKLSDYPITENPCPENNSSFLSRIVFAWFEPFAWTGYKKSLEFEDLWSLHYENTSRSIVPLFDKYWQNAVCKTQRMPDIELKIKQDYNKDLANGGDDIASINYKEKHRTKEASIVIPLCKAFGPLFLFGCFLKLIQDMLTFVSPQILRLLIDYVEGSEYYWRGLFYAFLLLFVAVIQTLLLSQYFHRMYIVGMRIRTALVSAIYRKALCISNVARRDFTMGEIVNLMSVDAQRFVELTAYINMIWSAPLQIVLALYFLWQILGPSVLAGLAVMIILIPVNGLVASRIKSLQISQMKNKDNRVKLMNEILSGIKVLKLYAWEPSFEKQIQHIRNKEVQILKSQAYLNAATSFIWACAPFLVSLVTFGVYVLSSDEHVLTAKTAFVSLSLFNILRFPLSMLPMMISNMVQAAVSVKRINKFLNSPELNPTSVTHDTSEKDPLVIENGTFSWGNDGVPPTLTNINIRIPAGSLVAVVGPVGTGKSSLISALLGEMYKFSGRVNTKGSIAYVPQQAWIQNATLRANITFGNPLNSSAYNKIIRSCALEADLNVLPGRDMTEIGEKGINLSGGQKQRISLARAVYSNADVFLLDDPLSAVDAHVGKHIFEHVIGPKGMLKDKTRVLVTHGITYLSEADYVIVLKNGTISESGTYEELVKKKGDFAEFLLTYLQEINPEIEEDITKLKELLQDVPELEQKLTRQISQGSETSSMTSLNRQKSISENEDVPNTNQTGQKLIETERAETGNIKWPVYAYYLSSIGTFLCCATILMNLAFQGFSVSSSMWLSAWSSDKSASVDGVQDTSKRNLYLTVYAGLGFGQAVSAMVVTFCLSIGAIKGANASHALITGTILHWPISQFYITPLAMATIWASLLLYLGIIKASNTMHCNLLKKVLQWPMALFDVTPTGRIVSRFSYDIDLLDNTIGGNIRHLMSTLLTVTATIFIISYSTPIFMSVILPIGAVYFFVQRFYVATSRQLKRLESVSRSPIYSHFGETVSGAQSIRAYGLQDKFILESEKRVDFNQKCYYPSIVSNRWLAVRLESVGNLIIFFAALFAVFGKDTLSSGLVGLSISYALQITQTLNWLVRMSSEVETNIVAVERIKEYGETPQEAAWEIPTSKPPETWPEKGEIEFQDYRVRYREGLDLVLKGVSFTVKGGEKIGIVGRTGAGKSSLTLCIFRIIESAGGKIVIDGIDISTLGLHALRSRLTIIPQDPILFSGTLRVNLDPVGTNSDDSIWHALELSHLKTYVSSLPLGLQHEVTEGGENFSVGQRQLICLARALLRKSKILVLDEATAAVDLETDDLIQTTIRKEFSDCTILTIAHRLNTIMDYDRVIVLDKGKLREFDSPATLIKSRNSMFYAMAADAGLA